MWVRGLKHHSYHYRTVAEDVASYVGAWIETTSLEHNKKQPKVASYVGAWIETDNVYF